MKTCARVLVFILLMTGSSVCAQNRFNISYSHFPGVPTGTCTAPMVAEDDANGTFYTCSNGLWSAVTSVINSSFINTSFLNNTIWMDGVKYPYTAAGLQQAIIDANGHGGLAGVVMIGSTANGVSSLQQIALGSTTITMPSFTYIVGAGRDATGVDYQGTGAAFDFPAGTIESGIINLGVEIDARQPGTCFTFEGNVSLPTHDNIIQNVSCGSSLATLGQIGMTLTPTPAGSNGANYIRDNIFQNVWFNNIQTPIVSNGDFSNKFTGITVDGFSDSTVAVNGGFYNDRLELTVHKEMSSNGTALNVTGYGNNIDLYCDIGQTAGNICLNDAGGGNHVVVSNLNLTPLGMTNATSYTENLSPLPVADTVYLPATATATNCLSSASPAVCGSASAGSVAIPAGSSTLVVSTTAVTASSQILLTEDSSLGTRLNVACNTASGAAPRVAARIPGASFTIATAPLTNAICLSYLIIN